VDLRDTLFAVTGGVLVFVTLFILALALDFTPAGEPTFIAGTPVPVLVPVPVPFAVPGAPAPAIVPNEDLGAFSDPAGEFYCFPVDGAGF